MKLLIATNNAHKVEELGQIFEGLPITSLADFPAAPEPVEDAPDFAGNAIIKARAAHARTGLVSLADDSGIAVDALDGAPGVLSARYVEGSDEDRLNALLENMEGVADRSARFVCAMAVCGLPQDLELPEGVERHDDCVVAHGEVLGVLIHAPRGANGFGYDPIFELPHGRTTAELSADEKHAISHRGKAARALAGVLARVFTC